MRRFAAPAVLAIAMAIVGLTTAPPAAASTTLQDTATAINHGATVVVSPDTPGYNSLTRSKVNAAQTSPTVLVELPATATIDTGGNGQQFADALDAATGDKFIVAVAFVQGTPPNTTTTYYTSTHRLSSGLNSDDIMQEAESAGRGPESTLSNFGYYMDQRIQNDPGALLPTPNPKASANGTGNGSSSLSSSSHIGAIIGLGVVLLIICLALAMLVFVRRTRRGSDTDNNREKLPEPPDGVVAALSKIRAQIPQVEDREVGKTLEDICFRTTQLFDVLRRFVSEHAVNLAADYHAGTDNNRGRLTILNKTIEQYLYIQNHMDIWGEAVANRHLDEGAEGFRQYLESIMDAIRKAYDGQMAEFDVNTEILKATRHRLGTCKKGTIDEYPEYRSGRARAPGTAGRTYHGRDWGRR